MFKFLSLVVVAGASLLGFVSCAAAQQAAEVRPKPLKALLILGGCCHDYARQKNILKKGIESRVLAEVTIVYSADKSTKATFDIYNSPKWADGFDVVIHDECSADVKDLPYVQNILSPHKAGVPAINLHCAMHCYRTGTNDWFEFLGLQSSGHGPQKPIDIAFVAPEHPIVKPITGGNLVGVAPFSKPLENWTTINEELYNNLKLFDTAKPIARGRQDVGNKLDEAIVAWVNEYGPKKTRVFCTTLGHNNETVADPRYLDMICRALLWACDKTSTEYYQPFQVVQKELVPVNLARGKKVTASASQDGHPPEHAIDGKEETRWCSPNGESGYWWQVDLGDSLEVTGLEVMWESDDTNYRYKVEGSNDANQWVMLSDQTKSDSRDQTQILKFEKQPVRYVRLTTTSLTPGRWGSFWEIAVHGTKLEERVASDSMDLKPRSIKGAGLLSGIKVPAGFEVTLFAAPPDVNYPTCVASSPDGTVFVGIDENGSLDRNEGRGRIVRCRDTNGDGRADEFKTFASIDSPRGIVVEPNKLIVLAPPHLYAIHDENGDGVGDRTQTLVNGIGFDLKFRGADHTTNGIQVGIDGWIYIAVGDYGFIKATGSDGRELQYRGGGIVRCRPDGSELEVVSRGQRNIYDLAVSPELDLFTRDNTNDGGGWNVRLSHVPHGGHMGYPSLFFNFPSEIIQPMADYGGGSPCGSLFVDEPNSLPEGLGHALYTCDWGRSIVYRHPLTRNGAGFTAEQEPFVELPRPTDMDVDARGNLYISSWKDGGFNFSKPEVGFVVRVHPTNAVVNQSAKVVRKTDAELLKSIASASHTIRLNAQREILKRGEEFTLVTGLEELCANESRIAARVAALFTLKQLIGERSHTTLVRLAKDPSIREHALRAIGDRTTQLKNTSPASLADYLRDPNARVRMQAVRGLSRFGMIPRNIQQQMLPLTVDADPVVAHVAVESLVQLKAAEVCQEVLLSSATDKSTVELRPGAAAVLRHLHDPSLVSALIEWLSNSKARRSVDLNESGGASQRALVLATMCRLHSKEGEYTGDWWGTRPDTSGPYYKAVSWTETERISQALQTEMSTGDSKIVIGLLAELKRHKIDLPGTNDRIVTLAHQDKSFFSRAVELLSPGNSMLSAEAARLLEVGATFEKANIDLRTKALRGLQRRVSQAAVIEPAIRAFSEVDGAEKNPEVIAAWNDFIREPALGKHITGIEKGIAEPNTSAGDASQVREFFYAIAVQIADNSRCEKVERDAALKLVERAWMQPEQSISLLKAIGRSNAESQSLAVQTQLKSDHPGVKAAAQYAANKLELDKEPTLDHKKPLISAMQYGEVVAALATAKGDEKYGRKLFARQGCSACHTVSQGEPPKGPLLLDISKRYKKEELIESIMKPSAKIAQGFEAQFFVTNDGKTLEGFVVRESGEEVELRNAAGISSVLKKSEIDERGRRDISVMPLGLVDKLNVDQVAALLAYLDSLKGK